MTLTKFIITMDGYLRQGMVNQHKDLQIGDESNIADVALKKHKRTDKRSNKILYINGKR